MDFRTMLKKKKYAKNVNDEGDPDWGKLKKVERPDGSDSDPDKQVNNPLFLRHYFIFNIILYIYFVVKFVKWLNLAFTRVLNSRKSPKIACKNGDSKKLVKT